MQCRYIRTLLKTTWFDHAKVDLDTNLRFVNFYLQECFSYSRAKDEFNLLYNTVCDWASFCHEVLVHWCLQHQSEKIGGDGEVGKINLLLLLGKIQLNTCVFCIISGDMHFLGKRIKGGRAKPSPEMHAEKKDVLEISYCKVEAFLI